MIGKRNISLLGPIWRFHRWFDDLEKMNMNLERFMIFLTMVIFFNLLCPMIGVALGYDFVVGQIIGMMFFVPFGLTRIYWIDYYKHK